MEKDTLLHSLSIALRTGDIKKDEVELLLVGFSGETKNGGASSSNLAHLLYYIGGGIAFLGLVMIVGEHWEELGGVLRIFLTLGMGFAFFASAIFLAESQKLDRVPDALHLIAGLLIPGGIFITLHELGYRGGNWGPGIIFLFLTLSYVLAYIFYKRNILSFFAIIFGTFATLLITDAFEALLPGFFTDRYAAYRILGIGASYIFLGAAFRGTSRAPLSLWLHGFGSLGVLGAALYLGGWKPDQHLFWEITYPGVVFGMMFLSVFLRSSAMLFFGGIFLVAYVFKITNEYFQDSLSWPMLLIFAGFLLIGVGYATFSINRKYLAVNK